MKLKSIHIMIFFRVFYQLILKQIQIEEMLQQKAKKHGGKAARSDCFADKLTIHVRKYDAEVFRMLIQFVHSGIVAISDKNVCGKLLCTFLEKLIFAWFH